MYGQISLNSIKKELDANFSFETYKKSKEEMLRAITQFHSSLQHNFNSFFSSLDNFFKTKNFKNKVPVYSLIRANFRPNEIPYVINFLNNTVGLDIAKPKISVSENEKSYQASLFHWGSNDCYSKPIINHFNSQENTFAQVEIIKKSSRSDHAKDAYDYKAISGVLDILNNLSRKLSHQDFKSYFKSLRLKVRNSLQSSLKSPEIFSKEVSYFKVFDYGQDLKYIVKGDMVILPIDECDEENIDLIKDLINIKQQDYSPIYINQDFNSFNIYDEKPYSFKLDKTYLRGFMVLSRSILEKIQDPRSFYALYKDFVNLPNDTNNAQEIVRSIASIASPNESCAVNVFLFKSKFDGDDNGDNIQPMPQPSKISSPENFLQAA
ncbi:MAG: hypothetical protein RLZZ361_369 [Cyanobacteriota bacterium]